MKKLLVMRVSLSWMSWYICDAVGQLSDTYRYSIRRFCDICFILRTDMLAVERELKYHFQLLISLGVT